MTNLTDTVRRDRLTSLLSGPAEPGERWTPPRRATGALDRSGAPVQHDKHAEHWGNDLYSFIVRRLPGGIIALSYHRRDRKAVRDWRHEQAMKDAFIGPEGWAVMTYPPSSQLVDTSNEYHLTLFPAAQPCPFSFSDTRLVMTPAQAAEHGATQRAFEPALTPPELR